MTSKVQGRIIPSHGRWAGLGAVSRESFGFCCCVCYASPCNEIGRGCEPQDWVRAAIQEPSLLWQRCCAAALPPLARNLDSIMVR